MKARVLALCVAAFAIASTALGQASANLPASVFLLMRPDVQSDLQLSNGQIAQLDTIRQKMVHQPKRGSAPTQNTFAGHSALDAELAQTNQRAEAVLLEQQRARLIEIKIQLLGDSALLEPTVQKLVGITDEQKGQIATLQQQQQAKIRAQIRSGTLTGKQVVAAIRSSQQQVGIAMEKLLSPAQTAKLKELRGRPFHAQAAP